MSKDVVRQIFVVIATLVTFVINGLANALPLNGLTTGEVSDSFKVFFVPSGYVFAIWGLIYLLLIGYTIFQALPAQREHSVLRKIGWWYVVASAANSIWIFMWHYQQFPLTLVFMGLLLGSLIAIYLPLGIARKPAAMSEKLFIRLPFSVYLGWITVATIANISDVLYYLNWNGFGLDPQLWAVIMLAAALVIAAIMAVNRRDAAYLAVLIWAFVGIAVKFPANPIVSISAWAAAGVTGVLVILSLIWSPKPVALPAK